MNIEQRLDHIESRNEILCLVARYCHGADGRDANLFRRVWHSDAVWEVPPHRFVGHGEILEAVERQWTAFTSMHHLTSNSIVILESDDEATGQHDVIGITVMPDGRSVLTTGHYFDRYSRRAGSWAISERRALVAATLVLAPSEI